LLEGVMAILDELPKMHSIKVVPASGVDGKSPSQSFDESITPTANFASSASMRNPTFQHR
jgi:hypothetical protein